MTKDVEKQIKALYRSEKAEEYFTLDAGIANTAKRLLDALKSKYDSLFAEIGESLSTKMVNQVSKESATNLHRSMSTLSGGMSIKSKIFDSDVGETIKASVAQNVGLIKTIQSQYLDKVSSAVFRSIASGNGLEDLQPYFETWYGENTRKAKNVALDQTRKAYNSINADRMRHVGMNKFEWVHSGGGHKPREYHIDPYPAGLNGGIFDINDPPVIDPKTGERGLPGHAPNCKCVMRPLLEFGNDASQEG